MAASADSARLARALVVPVTATRADVDRRIAATEKCRDENRDLPELVARLNDQLDLLHEWHDAIPEPRDE